MGSGTVPVQEGNRNQSAEMRTGGGTPPELAGEDACGTTTAMPDAEPPNHLLTGFHSRGALPHLKCEGSTYFVVFRQAGTLPRDLVVRLKQERDAIVQHAEAARRPLTWHEQEELFRWYSHRVDKYLDSGHGACHLRQPAFADLVANAIRFFDGQRYELRAWVVMPNHAHVVVRPMPGHTLSEILHSWKSFTSHKINERLPEKVVPFWQGESYDHLICDDEDLHRCCHYTAMNPVNAGLCARPEDWAWSSAAVTQPLPAAGNSIGLVRENRLK